VVLVNDDDDDDDDDEIKTGPCCLRHRLDMASALSALFFEGLSLWGGMLTTVDADPTESCLRISGCPLFSCPPSHPMCAPT
jgi:hypothetical protein